MKTPDDSFILGRQVDLLYRNLRMGQIISIVNASFLVWVAHPFVTQTYLGMWWLIAVTVAGLRINTSRGFFALREEQRHQALAIWRQRALIGAAGSGLIWAAGTVLLMNSGDTILKLFTAFVMAGLVAGAVPALAADLLAFRAYALPIVLAVAVSAFGTDALHIAFSAMCLLFIATAGRSADLFHNTLHESFRLQHEKDRLAEHLNHARELAEQSNMAKTAFLANISHELRTPMNGIIGLGELLNLEDLSEDQRALLDPMRESANNLMTLITHLIQLSTLESGQVTLSPSAFVVGEMLDAMCANHRHNAQAKGLTLVTEQDPALPPVMVGDSERLRQIFDLLLGNAIKFTDFGTIRLQIRVAETSGNTVKVEFSVTDTGPGIAADKLPQLKGLFVQADGSSIRRHGGIGVGLPIARKLIELMGGELKIASEVGQGSCFSFTLPFSLTTPDTQW